MVYITKRQSPSYKQVSIEDLLSGKADGFRMINANTTNTRTDEYIDVPVRLLMNTDIVGLIKRLKEFNEQTESLREVERHTLYRSFKIPKKTGGFRQIDAPNDELMMALRTLKSILEKDFGALYHTSAFAYVRGRNTVAAMRRHQANESRWYAKTDFTNFFGNTTMDFTLRMLSMIFPFSEVMKNSAGRAELEKALELGFLDGGLPQGTPLSPTLTNIVMIPFDYRMTKRLNEKEQGFVYTRYADDTQISSKFQFDIREVENLIAKTLAELNAPFTIKKEKTRYGSSSGRNWNLGLMLNKDNQITVGAKRKREFKCMLHNYALDKKNGRPIDPSDIYEILGLHSYYTMVEKDTIERLVEALNKKMGFNIIAAMKKEVA